MTCPKQNKPSCVVDNAGLCHFCGRPMNFDYWLASIGPEAYMNPDAHIGEWTELCQRHALQGTPTTDQSVQRRSTSKARLYPLNKLPGLSEIPDDVTIVVSDERALIPNYFFSARVIVGARFHGLPGISPTSHVASNCVFSITRSLLT